MRERGLKQTLAHQDPDRPDVAPHAGAWIETNLIAAHLKDESVAPHAGAWIETLYIVECAYCCLVAPHAGAWIETI